MPLPNTTLYPQDTGLYPGDGGEVVPEVVTGAASAITTTSATLSGTVDPNGLQTHYYFQYEPAGGVAIPQTTETQPAVQTTEINVGNGSSPVSVNATLFGLRSGRYYSFRLVAFNGAGFAYGAYGTFLTLVNPLSDHLTSAVHNADRGQ